jgi:BMFP domain-containing protein YqiC
MSEPKAGYHVDLDRALAFLASAQREEFAAGVIEAAREKIRELQAQVEDLQAELAGLLDESA